MEAAALGQLIGRLTGWRRYLVSAVMGVVAVAAFPPYGVIPALIPAFALLIWLARSSTTKRGAFGVGLAFGFGHFLAGLSWIANAFTVAGGLAALAGWPAVAGLSLFLALYPALATLLFYRLSGRGPFALTDAVLFAALWTLAEWCRGWVVTGFPWNPLGSVWAISDSMLQVTSLVGVYGLGFITVFAVSAFAGDWWQGVPEKPRGWWRLPVAAVALLGIVWAGGSYRLSTNTDMPDVEGVRLRLVQPNIPQTVKWVPNLRPQHVQDQVAMSVQPAAEQIEGPTHVLWSETAIPFYVNGDAALLSELARAVPPGGYLISGGLRREGSGEATNRYNSLMAIDPLGRIAAHYNKIHLVPFGEYMPFRDYLPFGKLTPGRSDFAVGRSFAPLSLPGLPPFQPLICYEAIFPGAVVADDAPRPAWLLNITNDAWYGVSSGPHQHFAMVRIRAVEEGLPVVRVANTGISAVVDAFGRVRSQKALGERGVIDSPLPRAGDVTIYAWLGNLPILILALGVTIWRVSLRNRT